jgi:tetratricopeptide (TPR) repeat protein
MHVRGFAVLLSLFAIAPLLVAQSMSLPDSTSLVDPTMFGGRDRASFSFTSISGSLLGIDGHPISNTRITLQSVTTGRMIAIAVSSVNGSFEFSEVPPGDYEVVADKGLAQARQRVHCMEGLNNVTLHMDARGSSDLTGGDTISVAALRVPQKARDLFKKAQQNFQKEKLKDAWKFAEKSLVVCPTYSEALTLRGILRVANRDIPGAEKDLQASITSDSNYPLAYFAMGALQNIQGKFAAAQQTLEQGLRVQPTSWQGYFELSKSMLGQGNYRDALKDAVQAENMGIKYAPIHLVKANALMGLKFYGEAANEFARFLELDPGGPHSATARKSMEAAKSFAETASN